MLNISNNKVPTKVDFNNFKSGKQAFHQKHYKYFNRFLIIFAFMVIVIMFLPWTQNISSSGKVTTLKPSQRPQTLQSQIPGRIEQWFVQEGDFVNKGDTILRISEIKSDYFDKNLMQRTNNQIDYKNASVGAYQYKINALLRQIQALTNEKVYKSQQAKNKLLQAHFKVKSDSIDLEAAKTNNMIAKKQFDRYTTLKEEGLKATKDVEFKKMKYQETLSKLIAQENKFLTSKNNIINAKMEISRIETSYIDKISKAESDMYSAKTGRYDTEVQVSKLENSYSNYQKRNNLLYITAPQDGYINKVLIAGIGETFKEGEKLVGIMPAKYDLAVETFVKPIDLPLLHIGESVRVQFEGWPAIVFSGWPNASYGTYGAKVVAIQNFISPNGSYRVLLAPDKNDHKWPEAIRIGSGAKTIALLEDVAIWFELWRQLNSFPPNYYQPENKKTKK